MSVFCCAECGIELSRDVLPREPKEGLDSFLETFKKYDERVEYPPAGYYFEGVSLENLSNYLLLNEFDLQNVDIDTDAGGDYSDTYPLKCKKGHSIGTYNFLWQDYQFYFINPQKIDIKEENEDKFTSEETSYLEQRLYEGNLQEKKRAAYLLGTRDDYPAEKLLDKRKNTDNLEVKIVLTYFAGKKGREHSTRSDLEELWEEYRENKG